MCSNSELGETNMGYYADLIKEKRNSVQDKFSYKGALITILKKAEGKYTYTVTKDGREEGTNDVYPTQDKAEAEAKREVEVNWNEKEETKENENGLVNRHGNIVREFKYKGCDIAILGEVNRHGGVFDGSQSYGADIYKGNIRIGSDDIFFSLDRAITDAKLEVDWYLRDHKNSKEEKGYYAKLAEKKNAAQGDPTSLVNDLKELKRFIDILISDVQKGEVTRQQVDSWKNDVAEAKRALVRIG